MLKVLFLDIDGVLNSIRSAIALDGYPYPSRDVDCIELIKNETRFDLVALGLIQKVCIKTGAKIVLSSTWRFAYEGKRLQEFGDKLDLFIIDKTPARLTSTRGDDIAMWLADHKVDKYAIVDDDSDMHEDQLPFFVKTDHWEGLSYENYTKLLELLRD